MKKKSGIVEDLASEGRFFLMFLVEVDQFITMRTANQSRQFHRQPLGDNLRTSRGDSS